MDRETKKVTCPSGKEAEIKTYLNWQESRAIRLATARSRYEGKDISENEYFAIEDEMIKQGVVSYGGSAEKIVERLLAENSDDAKFLLSEISGLIAKKN